MITERFMLRRILQSEIYLYICKNLVFLVTHNNPPSVVDTFWDHAYYLYQGNKRVAEIKIKFNGADRGEKRFAQQSMIM